MLRVNFMVEFDEQGKIVSVTRVCNVPRSSCDECKFSKWCNRVKERILGRRTLSVDEMLDDLGKETKEPWSGLVR